ncbi:hypothetical protein [Nocardia sp. NPDC004722]
MRSYDEAFMQEIVYHLEGDWRACYEYEQVELATAEGHSLSLRDGDAYTYADFADRGKIVAYVSFGSYSGSAANAFRSTIRISKAKGAAKIAAEIRRRLLLAYWEEFDAAKARKQAIYERAAARHAQMKALADITGGWTHFGHDSGRQGELHDAMNSALLGAQFNADGSFKLSVKQVPADMVGDLVRLIQQRLQGAELATAG